MRFSGGVAGRSQMAHCVGFSVTALMALMKAVAAIVSANWRNSWPVMPGRKAVGRNTDISTSVMPMTGPITSSIALIVASWRRHAALDVVRHVLDDHDRVVDDDADRQHEAEQGRQC